VRSLVPLSLVLLFLAACHESPTEPPDFTPVTLSGRVVLAETGAPAAGARVVASESYPANRSGEGVADVDGNYRITGIPGGTYTILVYGAGESEAALVRSYLLNGPAAVLNLEISGNRCAVIEGTVLDRVTNLPIAGAVNRFGDRSVTTGPDGRFRMELGCPPPDAGVRHLWSTTHPDYQPREFETPVPRYSSVREIVLDRR